MLQDFRHALRVLLKTPGFTAVAVLTLAVGIGANTAIFSVVNAILLRPLPYPEPSRIVRVFERSSTSERNGVSNPNFLDWRERATSFDALAAFTGGSGTVLGGREAAFAQVYSVSAGFFRVFGVAPAIGRTFVAEETRVGGVPAVILSQAFWERTFGAERDLTRLRAVIAGASARVVGVMPGSFDYPLGADVWFPRELYEDDSGRTAHNLSVVGRLKADVPVAQAAAEMNAIAAQLKLEHGTGSNAIGATTMPLQDLLALGWRDQLTPMFGAVVLVLLIACANVATTLLAHGEERRTELAVRAALGAGRGRLVRQLLVQSAVLGLTGAAAGLLLAGWLVRALASAHPLTLPRFASIEINGPVLLFTLTLGVLTPLLFGLIPSLQASRGDVCGALAAGARGTAAPERARLRSVLVAAEVAIALVLLVGAALLLRSFANVLSIDPGFQPYGAVTVRMAVPAARYPTPEAAAAFYARLFEELHAIPGVRHAGATNQLPLGGLDFGGAFSFEGNPDEGAEPDGQYDGFRYSAGYRAVTPRYLEALGVSLRQGRYLADSDRPPQPPAAVVNEAFVRRFLPRANPIGVRFSYAGMDPVNPVFSIVGVVADIRHRSLVGSSAPEVFVSLYQAPFRARYALTAVIRAVDPAQAAAVAGAVRATIPRIEPDLPIELSTLDRVLADSIADRRFLLMVLGLFALVALLLSATGIYSVLAQLVARRTREIGIRMALGAEPGRVARMVLGSAMTSVLAGVVAGAVLAITGMRLIEKFLFGVTPGDPLVFLGAAAVLVAVALVAGYLPSRRATRVDPLLALRAE